MAMVLRLGLLLSLLLGALAIPSSLQKQVSQVREGRPAGWSGDRPDRQVSHPDPPPPPPPLSLASPVPLSRTDPPPTDGAARIKRSLTRHTRRRLHTPSSSGVNNHSERRFRSTHGGTPPQPRSLRRSRTRSAADGRAKNNRGLKKARRKKKPISATRSATQGDTARASYVISDTADKDQQTGLQEEASYLSRSFVRSNEQGQAFRHYSDSDHRSAVGEGITETGSPLDQAALGSRASRQTGIIDSDTILKDGQIFHRHDAREERNDISRGQSRRRHARPGDQQLLFDEAPHRDVGLRGLTDPGDFFTAEALNSGGQSQTRVSGNMHGVDGSAVTLSRGKVTQAAVTLGENSSSRAHITDHHGPDDPILASAVGADQRGGAADAKARASDAATTHAQIEFSPTDYDEAELGEHGTASALLTPNGESTLATLGGHASRGSYLGTAHSSTLQAQPYATHNTYLHPSYPSFDNAHVQPSFDNTHVQPSFGNDHTQSSFDNLQVQPSFDNPQVQSSFESEVTQRQDGGNVSHGLMDMSEMLSSIMETVHQPHVLPEAAALPLPGAKLIAAREGMVGGSGVPPQESEIGRVSQQLYQEQEGDGRQVAPPAAGQVGIATYFQGGLGSPPNDSDVIGPLPDYDFDPSNYYYDLSYLPDYQSPYLDLDPKVFSVEPLELDLGALHPTPPPLLPHPQPDLTSHSPIVVHQLQTTTPDLPPHASPSLEQSQEPPETKDHALTPEQPHISDHSLTTDSLHPSGQSHTPGQTQVPGNSTIPTQSPISGQPYTSDPLSSHIIPDYSRTPDHIPDYSQTTEQPYIADYVYITEQPYIPDYSYTPDYSQIPDQPLTPDHHVPQQPLHPSSFPSPQQHRSPGTFHTPDRIPAQPPPPDQTSSQRETSQHPNPRPSDTRPGAAAAEGRGSAGSVQATPMPMGVPLVPGQPGSTQMLPNGDDGRVLNVITIPANQRMDMSVMRQRPRASIQPGEKIPGAPGYRIPAGFRGHVILGHSLPVDGSSRHVAEGFNARVRLTPQSPASDTVFASVSSPQASQQLTSEGGVPGVHVTLGGGGGYQQQYRVPAPPHMASTGGHTDLDRGNQRYRGQWAASPTARQVRPSHRAQSGATLENSWQNNRYRPSATSTTGSWNQGHSRLPSKSWNDRQSSHQQRGKLCAYITITCRLVENDPSNRRQCQPSYTTRDCCC